MIGVSPVGPRAEHTPFHRGPDVYDAEPASRAAPAGATE